jgi:hypothetical protein
MLSMPRTILASRRCSASVNRRCWISARRAGMVETAASFTGVAKAG